MIVSLAYKADSTVSEVATARIGTSVTAIVSTERLAER